MCRHRGKGTALPGKMIVKKHLSSAADDSGASDGGASLDPEGAGIMLPEMSNLLDCAPLLVADEPSNDVSKWLENMDLQI